MKTQKHKILKVQVMRGLVFFMISLGLFSCQEELVGDTDPSTFFGTDAEISYSSTLKDQVASRVAKNIAASLDDPGVVDFLRTKASERIDGDFNFLIELNRNESLGAIQVTLTKDQEVLGQLLPVQTLSQSVQKMWRIF